MLLLKNNRQKDRQNARFHPKVQEALSDMVRSMNCYYSNLIEGHNTHPIDTLILMIIRSFLFYWSTNVASNSSSNH